MAEGSGAALAFHVAVGMALNLRPMSFLELGPEHTSE